MVHTEEKIKSFAFLSEGWDYGLGGPIAEKTIQIALGWHRFLYTQGFLRTSAGPGSDGDIDISASLDDHLIEIIVEPDERSEGNLEALPLRPQFLIDVVGPLSHGVRSSREGTQPTSSGSHQLG